MASPLCRSAAMVAARSIAVRSKNLLPKPAPSRRAAPIHDSSRSIAPALGSVESLLPLHSAIASARLKSFIAVDSSCWSWLSQGNNHELPFALDVLYPCDQGVMALCYVE
ncbi:hypothetical protein C4D60_Mb03t16130 [Musa balbisiana]|uniref:Uncharacterized protein n=1 Tax=Musa balbisiana TaxID=52838 RepID=A0A4S8JAM3_MUSBA|nr:hypothetical protein C4D60_Mb03t16130 [Musa balbisiana]